MNALKDLLLKFKSNFKLFVVIYAGLEALYYLSNFLYMIIYNVAFKHEYNVDYVPYTFTSFLNLILNMILILGILAILIFFLYKGKDKEAKFAFTGWFIYTLVSRIFGLFDGALGVFNNDGLGAASSILGFLGGLAFLLGLAGLMLEVFNGSKTLSNFSPLCFIIAFGLALFNSILSLVGLFNEDLLVFRFYSLFSIWLYPLFIFIMALVGYLYITPEDAREAKVEASEPQGDESQDSEPQGDEAKEEAKEE